MSEFDTYDQLIRYIDGEMSPEEKIKMEDRLNSDPDLLEELQELKIAIQAVKFEGLSSKVKGIHAEMSAGREIQKPGMRTITMFSRRTMSLAASVVIGLAMLGGWWFYKTQTNQILEDYYVEFSFAGSRGAVEGSVTAEPFNQKKFEDVIKSAERKDLNAQDSLAIALSYLHLKKYDKSEVWLSSIQRQSPDQRDDADYYLAFCLLAQKNYKRSYELFKAIHDDPDHLYHSAITDLMLKKIAFKDL